MSDDYTTPSQAEGERDDEDQPGRSGEPREEHRMTRRTTPSQAEGERDEEEE